VVFTTISPTIGDEREDSQRNWLLNWHLPLSRQGVRPVVYTVERVPSPISLCKRLNISHVDLECIDVGPYSFPGIMNYTAIESGIKRRTIREPAVDFKYLVALQLLLSNQSVCFSDSDVVWMKHPADSFRHDLEALSDDQAVGHPHDGWTSRRCGLNYESPCWSTGLWRARPTPANLILFRRMVNEIYETDSELWEQEMFNKQLAQMKAISLLGDASVLREHEFCNVPLCEKIDQFCATNGSAPNSSVRHAYHAGYVHGSDKMNAYKKLGLWHHPL